VDYRLLLEYRRPDRNHRLLAQHAIAEYWSGHQQGIGRSCPLAAGAKGQLNGAYAYLHSTNLTPYSPQNRLTYSLDLDATRAFISLGGNSVGRTYGDVDQTSPVGQYTLANIKCTAPVGKHTSLFVMVDNLFNRRYEVLWGYRMPGTNGAGGIDLKF